MGRQKISAVFQHFEFTSENQTSRCLVEGCDSVVRGSHAGNLKTHLRTCHPGIFKAVEDKDAVKCSTKKRSSQSTGNHIETSSSEPKQYRQMKLDEGFVNRTQKSIKFNIDSSTVIKGCIQLVTTNGRPFSVVEDSGFKTLMWPVLDSLKLTMNRKTVVEALMEQFTTEKNALIRRLSKKLIFMKIDIATRLDRHFLGINVQFFDGNYMKLKTLAVVEIKDGKTKSEDIKKLVENTLHEYKIAPDQILSITSDNGSNMLKAVRLMNESTAESTVNPNEDPDAGQENDTDECEEVSVENEVEIITDEEINDQSLPEMFDEEEYLDTINIPTIVSTRCAAHTLELSVRDALKLGSVKNCLQRARQVVKKLRTPSLVSMVIKRFGKKPILDNTTRWGSSYDMVDAFLNIKDGVTEWGAANPDLKISQRCWDSLKTIRDVLKPVREATTLLQCENLTPGDFYRIWTTSKIELQKFTTLPFAKLLVERMHIRERQLMNENPMMLAGIYLDPRYCVTLSPEQIVTAHEAIMSVSKRLEKLGDTGQQIALEIDCNVSDDDEDPFEAFLKNRDRNKEPAQIASTSRSVLLEAFSSYENIPREKNKKGIKFDLFDWWASNGPASLKDVARVIICLPSTQVSVERLFSALAFVLSERRSRMKDEVLNAVLFLRTNGF